MLLAFLPLAASLLVTPPKATQRPAKVLVKNIPFEADEHALRDKLATFGAVQSVQLAKASKRHHGRPHHGWAWVYFAAERSAWRACDSSRSKSLSLRGRALSVWPADHHMAPTDRSQRKRSAAEEHPLLRTTTPGEAEQRSARLPSNALVLERLQAATPLQSGGCRCSRGAQDGEEYQVSTAAWARARGRCRSRQPPWAHDPAARARLHHGRHARDPCHVANAVLPCHFVL